MNQTRILLWTVTASIALTYCQFTNAMHDADQLERCGLIARTHEFARELKNGIWINNKDYRDTRPRLGNDTTRSQCFALCMEKKEDLNNWEKDLQFFTCIWGSHSTDI